MTNGTRMINNGKKMELNTKRIEWINSSGFWLALFFGHVIFIIVLIVVYINMPKAFFLFGIIWYSPLFILPLLSPKRIVIDADILSILLIGRTINIRKSDIARINAFKLRGVRGRFYYFKIISNRPISIRCRYEMFPIVIQYNLKPYYDLEPSRIYDIVEVIENWFKKDNFVK
jgi:uncharacterized integral membrane protein